MGTSIRLMIGLALVLSLPRQVHAQAKIRYTQAQIQQIVQQERQKKIREAEQKDAELQRIRKAEAALQKSRAAGKCKNINIPFVGTSCSEKCILSKPTFRTERKCILWKPTFRCKKKIAGKCVIKLPSGKKCAKHANVKIPSGTSCVKRAKVCLPTKTNKRIELCIKPYKGKATVYINGKRDPILPAMRTAVDGLKKAYEFAEKQASVAAQKLAKEGKKRAEQVAKEASNVFNKALDAYRKAANKLAKQLANMPEWKRRLSTRLAITAATKAAQASSFARGKMRTELLNVLRTQRNYNSVKATMYAKQTGAKALRSYGKSAALSLGITIAFQAARISVTCWKQSGSAKRSCLSRELTTGMRDALFDIIGALVQIAVDLKVIEPVSHILAAVVAAKLAAATAGIGAAAYPIAYAASSLALNGVIVAIYEVALRPEYNKLFNKNLRSDVESFNKSLLSQLPEDALKCWGPCN